MQWKERKVLYVHDGRQYVDPNGIIYGSPKDMLFQIKERYEYLGAKVKFVQRAIPLGVRQKDDLVVMCDYGIDIIAVPQMSSAREKIKNTQTAKQILCKSIAESDIVILRNSVNASLAIAIVENLGKPYIMEVVSCAWDAYWNYSVKGKLYAPIAYLKMKMNVAKARYAMYVTGGFLQRRYPNKNTNIGISDVTLEPIDESIIAKKTEHYKGLTADDTIHLTTLAAVDVRYKGQHFVIEALAKLKTQGINNLKYHIAGAGDITRLRSIAKRYKVDDMVIFEGVLNRNSVIELLDKTDIYCQPSKQEGLPRAVVEAMSRGCVCVGSAAGGIPELLINDLVFRKAEAKHIAKLIAGLINDKFLMIKFSQQNFEKSKQYEKKLLDEQRIIFYANFLKENNLGSLNR